MRILTKYCLREELKLFFAALFFFSGLLLLGQVMNLLRLVLDEGAALWNMLAIVMLWFPSGVSYAIPMSLLFAILIGYGQMAQQEELTAIRAAGLPPVDLLRPAVFLGACLSVAMFINEAWVAPPTRMMFREKLAKVTSEARVENLITPGQMLSFGPIKFSCQSVEPADVPVFKNIFFEYSGTPAFRIMAQSAWVDRGGAAAKFRFEKGQILWTESEKHVSVQFDRAEHAIPSLEKSPGEPKPKDLSILDLRPGGGLDLAGRRSPFHEFEFHKKAALILAPFFFAFFAATLSMLVKRGNRVLGFMLTLSILAGYYILMVVAQAMQPASHDIACLMVWFPNALLFGIGYFFYRLIFFF